MTEAVRDQTVGAEATTDLEPVRRALLEDARHEAESIVADAAARAAAVVDNARAEADAEVARIRARAEASARARVERDLERDRAEARRRVLAAQAEVRRRLTAACRTEAIGLRRDPRYGDLLDRLEDLARSQLGPRAVIDRDPDPSGGVVATTGTHRVDYSLPALADRAIDELADDIDDRLGSGTDGSWR